MLFILTGNIQTGKTRWLCDLCSEVERIGVLPFGVVAPGLWRRPDEVDKVIVSGGFDIPEIASLDWASAPTCPADENGFEKLGIANVTLPDRNAVLFALRRDIACSFGRLEAGSQSEKAQLGWHMSDEAIASVDEHFRIARDKGMLAASEAISGESSPREALLVVDELGRLELLRGEGLKHAMELLAVGPTDECRHALIVVRKDLADIAEDKFAEAWSGTLRIYPNEQGRASLLDAL